MHLWVCVLTVLDHIWVPVVRNPCGFESHTTGPVGSLPHCQQVSWRWELLGHTTLMSAVSVEYSTLLALECPCVASASSPLSHNSLAITEDAAS